MTANADGTVTLRGRITRFIYRNEDKGFAIVLLEDEQSSHVIKGSIWGVEEGELLEVVARPVADKKYGKQLRALTVRPVVPVTADGIREHLARAGIAGVGKKVAERIVERFGDRTLEVIRDQPEDLRLVEGIGSKRAAAIAAKLKEQLARAESHSYLHGLGLGTALVRRIYEQFGEDAVRTVREKPYALARKVHGIGFATADRIAAELGIGPQSPERLEAGVHHVLDQQAGNGHTAPASAMVAAALAQLTSCSPDEADAAIHRLLARGEIRGPSAETPLVDVKWIATRRLHDAELELAADLTRLVSSQAAKMTAAEVDERLKLAAQALGFGLQGTQRAAVEQALHAGLMVITGGPGTGKTTIVQGLLAALAPDGGNIVLCAPTGRAARRLTETTLRDALTVHRLLEMNPHEQAFGRNRTDPLDAELVIVDESSMLDVKLAAALCAAIPPGGRLLLVGDADQLPSVGPGAVLGDVIAATICPTVRLDHIYRQVERSLIVENAHRVRRGGVPVGARDPSGDFFVIPREDPASILTTVLEVVCQRLPGRYGYDAVDDIQVLVPVHRGPLGTEVLNRELRARLNPHGGDVGGGLRIGDKVIQVRNNYDLDVQNGDVGRIEGQAEGGVEVRFGKRTVVVPRTSLDDLQLAYAITVHKSQGSEYPAVVMPLHASHRLLLQRNLLYTGITRARRFAVLIGQPSAISSAVANISAERRQTVLAARLRAEVAPPDHGPHTT